MVVDKGIHKATLKHRIMIGLDQLKLKIKGKEWTPESHEADFCCVVCGKVHRNCMTFNTDENPTLIKKKGDKTAKRLYTLDFCSDKCMNKYSTYGEVELYDLNKLHEHLESGLWRKEWINYYTWKQSSKK